MEDIILIRAYKSWDSSCFSQLYSRYIDDIYRFILRKTGDIEVAEDITSQVWIKILTHIYDFEEKSGATFKSWIYRIAYNAVVDFYRKQKETVGLDDIPEISLSEDVWKYVDDKEKLTQVKQYLETLSKNEQEVVFLRVWDDLSYKEISEILWLSLDNCKKIYSRSIKKIQSNIVTLICIILFLL